MNYDVAGCGGNCALVFVKPSAGESQRNDALGAVEYHLPGVISCRKTVILRRVVGGVTSHHHAECQSRMKWLVTRRGRDIQREGSK